MTTTTTRRVDVDIAVIGSGFAGSLAALALARRGRRVMLVERARHPRFAIGESSTPLANVLLEQLAERYDLPGIRPFCKWGTWKQARPDLPVGLKRGFAFFFHDLQTRFRPDPDRDRQLLVAASPHDAVGDTHWFRAAFDQELAAQAQAAGCVFLDETHLECARELASTVVLKGERQGQAVEISAGFVIDASGPRGFLHQAFRLEEEPLAWMPSTEGVYTHFTGVERWERIVPFSETPPFSPDTAALHHVFPGGWIWVLRFDNGVTSAGAALARHARVGRGPVDAAAEWERLLQNLPSVADQFHGAVPVRPFVHVPRLAFRSRRIYGDRWALLPSAAGVIDPLLSTGIPLTLLGLTRLLDLIDSTRSGRARTERLEAYARATRLELDITEQLVAALYHAMHDVPLFRQLSLLYFAAASYSEAARRLGRPERAPGFLLCGDPQFGRAIGAAAALGQAPTPAARARVLAMVESAIEPYDVAGLMNGDRRGWYPVVAGDLISAAPKLQASTSEVAALLERCGMAPSTSRQASPAARQ
jgi:FADH2 O2-dependent halogenase